jgi:hypothetical protein
VWRIRSVPLRAWTFHVGERLLFFFICFSIAYLTSHGGSPMVSRMPRNPVANLRQPRGSIWILSQLGEFKSWIDVGTNIFGTTWYIYGVFIVLAEQDPDGDSNLKCCQGCSHSFFLWHVVSIRNLVNSYVGIDRE